ncbi:MAG: 4-aminobutyrate--2-oxoglutarate transaminase [Acidobacteria bacterium]|nr:4-aminobutyrate--2-oxoglutarate transaminase [Acidobacteriota bacterium]
MQTIQIRTPVPGPNSRALSRRREEAVPRGLSHATPVYVARAEESWLEDVDGNRFLDFAGGIGCLNTGHRNGATLDSIQRQLEKFLHTCAQVTPYENYIRIAERLNQITPGAFAKKTLLVNTGAEAVENAIKIARAYTRRGGVVAFEDAFHGRTIMTLALTSKTHPYKAGFAPFPGDVYRIPYAYCYRCSYCLTYPSCKLHCARHLEDTFKRVAASEDVAALIVEPVLGEGGFVTPPREFLPIIADICRAHGVLVIADEIQSGFGRTGKMFACEHSGIEPDILVTAKSLGGGLPLAAVTGRSEIMDAPAPGGLGGTFAGNPLSCAAADAVLDMFDDGRLLGRANAIGLRFERRAREWQSRFDIIGDIRGMGAMRAIELVNSRATREPAPEATKAIVRDCYEHGLIVLTAGTYGNVIRLLVPLVASDEQMDEGLDILENALASRVAGKTLTEATAR